MTHEEAFLRAIVEAPDDPAPRLVFADWLEEHGGGTTPHLIRLFRDRPPRRREPLWFSGLLHDLPDGFEVGYYCGFVDAVRCETAAFLGHAAALFRTAPVTEVRLTDREPGRIGGRHYWLRATEYAAQPWRIPVDLAYAMNAAERRAGYVTPTAAHVALSAACVTLGRRLAGLPAPAPAPA